MAVIYIILYIILAYLAFVSVTYALANIMFPRIETDNLCENCKKKSK